jgi:hypothetical protein
MSFVLLFSFDATTTPQAISCFSSTSSKIRSKDISDFAGIYANLSMALYPTTYDTIGAKGRKIYKWNLAAACVIDYDTKPENVTYNAIGDGLDPIKKQCCLTLPSCAEES